MLQDAAQAHMPCTGADQVLSTPRASLSSLSRKRGIGVLMVQAEWQR